MTNDHSATPPSRASFILRVLLLLGIAVAAAVWLSTRPPIHQDPNYHNFADQRTLLGVPHFWNVVSNLPFLLLGLAGLWMILRTNIGPESSFLLPSERWPYLLFFAGVAGTAFGSAYYHLEPTDARLLWDRIPMAVAFTALCSAMIAERISVRFGVALTLPLVATGIASVLYWSETGDLRPYYFVQFFPALGIPLLILLFPARYTGIGLLFLALFWYVVAKLFEHPFDHLVFFQGRLLSGHTLKHLFAAVSIYCILRMVRTRRPAQSVSALLGDSAAPFGPKRRLEQ